MDAETLAAGPLSPGSAHDLHREAYRTELLPMWTVFGPNTADHPGVYVARLYLVRPKGPGSGPTRNYLTAATLEEITAAVPPGLAWLERSPDDDPNVLGVWI